jgi:hypothetical protein
MQQQSFETGQRKQRSATGPSRGAPPTINATRSHKLSFFAIPHRVDCAIRAPVLPYEYHPHYITNDGGIQIAQQFNKESLTLWKLNSFRLRTCVWLATRQQHSVERHFPDNLVY